MFVDLYNSDIGVLPNTSKLNIGYFIQLLVVVMILRSWEIFNCHSVDEIGLINVSHPLNLDILWNNVERRSVMKTLWC
jgi:hypothetical protein